MLKIRVLMLALALPTGAAAQEGSTARSGSWEVEDGFEGGVIDTSILDGPLSDYNHRLTSRERRYPFSGRGG